MTTSLYFSGGLHAIEWACVLHDHCIQNDWVKQWICIKFCIKLKHSSAETIRMIQKATAMGNWWLAASSQHICWCIMSHTESFGKTSNHPVTQPSYSPDLVPCDFCLFPKLKSSLKGKRFQTINENQENMTGQLMVTGRTVWSSKVPTWRGLSCHCPVCSVSCILFNFHITWLDTFWTDLVQWL